MKLYTSLIFIFSLLTSVKGYSKSTDSTDFYSSIKNFDLSRLWRADSLISIELEHSTIDSLIYYKTWTTKFPEPLGFIGNDYQRFKIHYLSVKKNQENPYQYLVTGKTKVKNNICNFSGTITIIKSKTCKDMITMIMPKTFKGCHDLRYKEGVACCECDFFEDSTQQSSGIITGKLKTQFYLDSNENIFYDNLNDISDGFTNNQFIGTWKSYKTNITKKCNWGDYRIPDCGDLDEGAGEFSPYETYLKYGWQSYRTANWNSDSAGSKKAKLIENEQWWK